MTREWHSCDLCGSEYPDLATALRCCAERFEDDDDDPDVPFAPTAVDDHGYPIVTDGSQVTRWHQLSGPQRDLLLAIGFVIHREGRPNRLALKRQLEETLSVEVPPDQLTPVLDSLVERDLVEETQLDRRTSRFDITRSGQHILAEHLRRCADLFRALPEVHTDDG